MPRCLNDEVTDTISNRLQTTPPTRGETVTEVTNCCANCVVTSCPPEMGA